MITKKEKKQCPKLEIVMSEYYDNKLPEEERKEIESHIAQCEECESELRLSRAAEGRMMEQYKGNPKKFMNTLYPDHGLILEGNKLKGNAVLARQSVYYNSIVSPRTHEEGKNLVFMKNCEIESDFKASSGIPTIISGGEVWIGSQSPSCTYTPTIHSGLENPIPPVPSFPAKPNIPLTEATPYKKKVSAWYKFSILFFAMLAIIFIAILLWSCYSYFLASSGKAPNVVLYGCAESDDLKPQVTDFLEFFASRMELPIVSHHVYKTSVQEMMLRQRIVEEIPPACAQVLCWFRLDRRDSCVLYLEIASLPKAGEVWFSHQFRGVSWEDIRNQLLQELPSFRCKILQEAKKK